MNIYVSNISTRLKNDELMNMFLPFGTVDSADVAMDAFTDLSRGFGFVEMPNNEQAEAAIAALNNLEVNGQKLSVQQSAPKIIRQGSYKVGNGAVNIYRFKRK